MLRHAVKPHEDVASNSSQSDAALRRLQRTALGGALGCGALLALRIPRDAGEALVALAVGGVVPLGVALAAGEGSSRAVRLASWSLPCAAPPALMSFALPPGRLAGALALPWLLATMTVALAGLQRLALRGLRHVDELVLDLGHLYLPVGGAWLLASRAGLSPMGFAEPIVLYTAAHFHYAGFAAPVVLGLLGRARSASPQGPGARALYTGSAAVVAAGVPLVAVGITVSRSLESPAAVLLGAGMLCAAGLLAHEGLRRGRSAPIAARVSGALLGVAAGSLVLSMGFAVAFALTGSAGRASPGGRISFSTMASVHGTANALGFALCALLAFALHAPPPPRGRVSLAWPRLLARRFVGVDFFERAGAVDPTAAPRGQLDALDDFAREGFDPDRVDPRVRAFYERTAEYSLLASPTWHGWFRRIARVAMPFARRHLGQFELPLEDEGRERVSTRLFALRASLDGREGARGYVRVYGEGAEARANYVGAYARQPGARGPTLSCAFPLPWSALLGVLRFEQGARPGGLALSSERADDDDAGMFLVTTLGALRLPMRERIEVWVEGEALRAEHDVWVCGRPCVTLRYALLRHDPGEVTERGGLRASTARPGDQA